MTEEVTENAFKAIVASRIVSLRVEKHLLLKDVAQTTGCDESTLRGWERGLHTVSIQYRSPLARALGVTVSALFARTADRPPVPPSFQLIETEHELPEILMKQLAAAEHSLKGFRVASNYGTHRDVQTEFRAQVANRILDGSLHVERVEVFYNLDRLKEVLSNIIRFDGKSYRVKAYCLGIDDTAPGMGGYIFDDHDVILGAYWPDTPPPEDARGLILSGDVCREYFGRYWREIWRRGTWINKMGASDLRPIRHIAMRLGLADKDWLSFLEQARSLEVPDHAPPLF